MHDFIVDRHAADGRKGNLARNSLEERHGPLLEEKFLHAAIDLTGSDAGPDEGGRQLMRTPDHQSSAAHRRNFASRTKIHHGGATNTQEK
jgi:hypothetical protein